MKAYRARAHYRPEEGDFSLDGVKKWHRGVRAFTQFHRRPLPVGAHKMEVVYSCLSA